MYVTIFARDWAQKKHLAILRQHKIFLRRDNFCPRLGTKKHLAILRQHKIFSFTCQFLAEIGHKKNTLLYLGSPKFFHVRASEHGRSALFKNPLFFQVNSWVAIQRQHKILSSMYIFCPRLGTKKSPCSIGHKRLSSKAIFTKFFCQVNSWIAILRQHKILSGTYIFCPRLGTKNFPH